MPIADLPLADSLQGSASGTYWLPPAMSMMCPCYINKLLIYLAIHGYVYGEQRFKRVERGTSAGAGLHLSRDLSSVRGAVEPVHSVSQDVLARAHRPVVEARHSAAEISSDPASVLAACAERAYREHHGELART
jgi:hypothetical protein